MKLMLPLVRTSFVLLTSEANFLTKVAETGLTLSAAHVKHVRTNILPLTSSRARNLWAMQLDQPLFLTAT
jgi:hypothetical protein